MPISIDEYKNKMENTLKIFHDELNRLRTGRATPSLLEPLFVDAYNSKMKISELATGNAPEPKLLTVQVWDKSMGQNIEKSIRDSELGLNPLARILYQSSAAHDPKWFTTAPIKAIKKILIKANMEVNDIDLWEINEAFAPVVMSVMDDYNLDHGKINVNGGAIALGHPIGASGARILTTLIHALNHKDLSVGLATLCIGGGEASALIIERVN